MELIVASVFGLALAALLVVLDALLFSLPLMCLWNAVVPQVLGVKAISWPQALWLMMICGLLFRRASARAEGK